MQNDAPWMSRPERPWRASAGVFMHAADAGGLPPRPGGAGPGDPGLAGDHSLASITDRIAGRVRRREPRRRGRGPAAVLKNADGSAQRPSGSTAPWHGNVPVDALAERLGVLRRLRST